MPPSPPAVTEESPSSAGVGEGGPFSPADEEAEGAGAARPPQDATNCAVAAPTGVNA